MDRRGFSRLYIFFYESFDSLNLWTLDMSRCSKFSTRKEGVSESAFDPSYTVCDGEFSTVSTFYDAISPPKLRRRRWSECKKVENSPSAESRKPPRFINQPIWWNPHK